jgi:hypothetical protein
VILDGSVGVQGANRLVTQYLIIVGINDNSHLYLHVHSFPYSAHTATLITYVTLLTVQNLGII